MTSTAHDQHEDFSAELALPLSPPEVLALFTSAEGVSRWWGPTDGDAGVGGTLVTSFGDYGVNAVRVRQSGPSRVVWESIVLDGSTSHAPEWRGTTMEFDIHPDGDGTRLLFRHVGLTPQLDCWTDCSAGWTQFLASIQTLAETGTGAPFAA